METKKTNRGFDHIVDFKNFKGKNICIQKSSFASDECIWFGEDKLELIKWLDPKKRGAYRKLIESEIKEYQGNNLTQLNRDDVARLIPILTHFVKTGDVGCDPLYKAKETPYSDKDLKMVLDMRFGGDWLRPVCDTEWEDTYSDRWFATSVGDLDNTMPQDWNLILAKHNFYPDRMFENGSFKH